MFWTDDTKKKNEEMQVPMMTRFFRACLSLLAGVIVLWLALYLLAQFWGWLLLMAGLGGLTWAAVWLLQWRRDRRW